MDIESKAWRVRSSEVVVDHVEITSKRSNTSRYVPFANLPGNHNAMAMMKEADFDRAIALAFDEGRSA